MPLGAGTPSVPMTVWSIGFPSRWCSARRSWFTRRCRNLVAPSRCRYSILLFSASSGRPFRRSAARSDPPFCPIAASSRPCFFAGCVAVSCSRSRFSPSGPIRPRRSSRCGVAIAPATWRTRSRRAIADTAPPRRMRGACRRHAMSHAIWWGRHARRRGVRRTHSGPAGTLVASALVLSRFFVSWLSHLASPTLYPHYSFWTTPARSRRPMR